MPSMAIVCGATSRWQSRCSRSQTSCGVGRRRPAGRRRRCAPRAGARRGPRRRPRARSAPRGRPGRRRARRAAGRGTRCRARRPRPRCRRTSPGRSPRRRSGRSRVGGVGGRSRRQRYRSRSTAAAAAGRPAGWMGRMHRPGPRPPDAVTLTEDLVNIESVSRNEQPIADAVEAALRGARPPRRCSGSGNTVVARTDLGRDERVVIAGHLDTVPLNDNLPARRDGDAPARPRHLRHEGRRRGRAAARRDACPSRTATSPTSSTSARRSRPSATACSLLAAERPRAARRPTSRS